MEKANSKMNNEAFSYFIKWVAKNTLYVHSFDVNKGIHMCKCRTRIGTVIVSDTAGDSKLLFGESVAVLHIIGFK